MWNPQIRRAEWMYKIEEPIQHLGQVCGYLWLLRTIFKLFTITSGWYLLLKDWQSNFDYWGSNSPNAPNSPKCKFAPCHFTGDSRSGDSQHLPQCLLPAMQDVVSYGCTESCQQHIPSTATSSGPDTHFCELEKNQCIFNFSGSCIRLTWHPEYFSLPHNKQSLMAGYFHRAWRDSYKI